MDQVAVHPKPCKLNQDKHNLCNKNGLLTHYTQSKDVGTVMQVFQLPKALAYPLFYKLVAPNSSSITRDAILSWFDEKNVIQVFTLCGVSMTFVSNKTSKN